MDAGISKIWIIGVSPRKSATIFKAPQRSVRMHLFIECAVPPNHAVLLALASAAILN
jgi:hypothetical protein